ncbi:1307_t:CDS:2 [Cetraspora pellucida]|uniref:1307_t:CDS:1 n=1 Tax=Cetraspora pellucida TaxID=1433469 RepID=A0A9N9FEW8_9GLOM|nr:1307_t:CDS:2 [Cetraspora pellucida]
MSGEEESSKRRRVARACDACRRKKVRCDGVQSGSDPPSCTNCRIYNYECSFIDAPKKRGPPKGYIEALETRLQRMESVLGNLVQSGNLPESVINSNLEWININENSFKNNIGNNLPKSHDSPSSNNEELNPMKSHESHDSDTDECLSSDGDHSCDLSDSMGQLSIDVSGHTRYIGNSSGITIIKKFAKKILKDNSNHRQECFTKPITHSDKTSKLPPKELRDQLLDIYWRECHSYMPFINKEEFMEKYNDLENNQSLIILLYAMFAITAKHHQGPAVYKNPDDPSTVGEEYIERAKELLKDEFDNPTITNVQALVLLAGNLQGSKNPSSWLYVGIAIRLAQDMGLHRDSSKWNLDARQTEIRRRVWWSCVMIDRLSSAQLGRPLAINEAEFDVDLPTNGLLPDDPTSNAWIEALKIILILGRVLSHVYGIKAQQNINNNNQCLLPSLHAALNEWKEKLPKELQYDYSNLTFDGPINRKKLLAHLLFYTVQILLHRPHIRCPKSKTPPSTIPSLTICTKAANHIIHILHRLVKEGRLQQSWSYMVYPFFTSTTMHLINAFSGDNRFREVAKHGLRMVLRCLDYMKPHWFAAERKRRSTYHSTNLDDMSSVSITNEIPVSSQSPSTPPSIPSQINSTPASIREYSAAIRQHMINHVPSTLNGIQAINYDPNSSPASDSSVTSYMSFNDPMMKTDNELFIDSHIPEVSSFLFNDCENNPFLSLPISLDWTTNIYEWSDLIGLQQTNMNNMNGLNDNVISNQMDQFTNNVIGISTTNTQGTL